MLISLLCPLSEYQFHIQVYANCCLYIFFHRAVISKCASKVATSYDFEACIAKFQGKADVSKHFWFRVSRRRCWQLIVLIVGSLWIPTCQLDFAKLLCQEFWCILSELDIPPEQYENENPASKMGSSLRDMTIHWDCIALELFASKRLGHWWSLSLSKILKRKENQKNHWPA